MAVTFIDPSRGGLADALTNLGTAAVNRKFARNIRERQLAEDPSVLASLAPAARRAAEAGQLESFSASLNVRPEFVQSLIINAFQPTTAERADVAFGKAGGPELQADAKIKELIVAGRGFGADIANNLPELKSEAEAATARRLTAENAFNESVFRKRTAAGLDRITVDLDVLQAQAKAQGLEFDMRVGEEMKGYLDSLDPNSHAYETALLGLADPAALAHIAQHEQFSLTERLSMLSNAPNDVDRLKATKDVQDELTQAFDAVRELEAAKAPQDELDAARARLNNWALNAKWLEAQGLVFPMAVSNVLPGRGFFGGAKGVEFSTEEVSSPKVLSMLRGLRDGYVIDKETGEQIPIDFDMLTKTDEEGNSAVSVLLPVERQQFLLGVGKLQQAIADEEAINDPLAAAGVVQRKLARGRETIANMQTKVNRFRAELNATKDEAKRKELQGKIDGTEAAISRYEVSLKVMEFAGTFGRNLGKRPPGFGGLR